MILSRRRFMQATGAGLLASPVVGLSAQAPPALTIAPMQNGAPDVSRVVMVHGDDRQKNITAVLEALDDQIRPQLKRKKVVVIKPNCVSTVNQLAATHADTLRAIIEYLAPRFHGPIVIAESSAGNTPEAFENFHYNRLPGDYRKQKITLVDLNTEGKYVTIPLIDYDMHVTPVRIAERLVDPDAFVISSAMMKAHNTVVATLSVKNMVMGSPLHYAPGAKDRWSDKHKYHISPRYNHYNMLLTAQHLRPNWGVAVIDGYEGLEGDGPMSGTPVASRIAIASTDFIAADRVGVDAMGVDPSWVGYLTYAGEVGIGNYDMAKIKLDGPPLDSVRKKYRLHHTIERQLQWRGPMEELPPKFGDNWNRENEYFG